MAGETRVTEFGPGIRILGPIRPGYGEILTPEAVAFLADLERRFGGRRLELLARRVALQARYDAGQLPHFLEETAPIRAADWTVAPIPTDLQDRRVEITGPVDRKMIINALNSGASTFMADFEDSNAPTWSNQIEGQLNLRDAIRGTITYTDPNSGKNYRLNEKVAVLLARPRGWHLPEAHVEIDGRPMSGSLFDFGLYFFHNAKALLAKGSGPYFYLPKMQSHLEARLWNDVFTRSEEVLGVPHGSVRGTVLIETLPAAFEMDEILYELRDHSGGLNCGRWDYIFSYIKTTGKLADYVLPDRSSVSMAQPFMRAYTQLLIKTCHRRGIHAMGGMAAFIPIKNDPEANAAALEKVRADKLREVTDGHDGTWVAHPGLVGIAKEIFDAHMPTPNQIHRKREDYSCTEADLLAIPTGPRTEKGLRWNIRVGVQYLEAWLGGNGCVPLYNLMEDAATAEISRTQVWQWIYHGTALDDGRQVTPALFRQLVAEEMASVREEVGAARYDGGKFAEAIRLFDQMSTSHELKTFLTLPAYEVLSTLND